MKFKILKQLDHPNIVKLIDTQPNDILTMEYGREIPIFSIALELCRNGELFQFLLESGKCTELIARHYFHQLCEGIAYLHSKGISHMDLKPENVLFDEDFNIKIIDFGLSLSVPRHYKQVGTKNYTAPEVVEGKEEYWGQSVDVFTLGVMLFVMVTKTPPFYVANNRDPFYKHITSGNTDKFWELHAKSKVEGHKFISESLKNLITMLLDLGPTLRPSIAEIQAHEWYSLPLPTKEELIGDFRRREEIIISGYLQPDGEYPNTEGSTDIISKNTLNRSITSTTGATIDFGQMERVIQTYIPGVRKYTQFFSTSAAEVLFDTLAQYASKV